MNRARSHPTWLWLLLAAALFTRALLPPGYMPERSASGAIAVKLCGSDGAWLIPLGDHDTPGAEKQRADQPCAFAGLASATPPPAPPMVPPPLAVALGFSAVVLVVENLPALRLLPPSRAPPLPA